MSGRAAERTTEITIAALGLALIACAAAANQQWFDRHFLPDFFVPRARIVQVETNVRIATVAAGAILLLLCRRPLARFLVRDRIGALLVALAIAASFCAAELVLRQSHLRAKEEVSPRNEPRRHLDAQLGWLFVPSRSGYQTVHGRRIEYAFDRNGYRVRRVEESIDFERPTILFTGESMMVGEKLQWDETFAAQTARLMNLQAANLAVSGFASDQAYLRLKTELPRFRHPKAVVILFSPSLFDRNLDDDRPSLGPGLRWSLAERRWRLAAIARRLVRYRSDDAIERGIAVTREVLKAGVDLAQSRGSEPLIVVPQFGDEEPRERTLRRRILDEAALPYLFVPLDPTWRVRDDGHPDVRGAHAIALAIANRLHAAR